MVSSETFLKRGMLKSAVDDFFTLLIPTFVPRSSFLSREHGNASKFKKNLGKYYLEDRNRRFEGPRENLFYTSKGR